MNNNLSTAYLFSLIIPIENSISRYRIICEPPIDARIVEALA